MQNGSVVWAPYDGGEWRLRVVENDGTMLTLKRPGADAGLVTVPASECCPSGLTPHTLDEIRAAV